MASNRQTFIATIYSTEYYQLSISWYGRSKIVLVSDSVIIDRKITAICRTFITINGAWFIDLVKYCIHGKNTINGKIL